MMKLHLACGKIWLEGFRNIDLVSTEATDEVCDLRDLDYPPGSVSEIVIFQTLQFFTYDELRVILGNFHRWLADDGRLYISIPNFNRIVLRYPKYFYRFNEQLSGDILGFKQPHRSLFTSRSFRAFVSQLGFCARVTVDERSKPHWTMTTFELVKQSR